MNVTYIARRSLIAGHVAGTEYSLTIATSTRTPSRRVERVQQKTLSGLMETLYFHGERNWRITFEPVNGDAAMLLREMMDSTESGEAFGMTLYGESNPPVNVKRTDSGYDFARFLEVGDLDEDWMQAAIEVVEQ